jgi:hypothetical protein
MSVIASGIKIAKVWLLQNASAGYRAHCQYINKMANIFKIGKLRLWQEYCKRETVEHKLTYLFWVVHFAVQFEMPALRQFLRRCGAAG